MREERYCSASSHDSPNREHSIHVRDQPFQTAHLADIEPEHLLNHFLRLCIKTARIKVLLS